MRVIDCPWEHVNLGVTTKEVVFDTSDFINDVMSAIELTNSDGLQYVVFKIPSERADFLSVIQNYGFVYMEDQIEVEHDLHFVSRDTIRQRLYDSVSYCIMDEFGKNRLFEEIDNGMFSTDRISYDSYFSSDASARRYKNWINSLIDNNSVLYSMFYKNEPSGFIILKPEGNGVYRSVLGGTYEKYRKTGLGMVQKEQEIVRNLGGKKVMTSVSSNNLGQLRALIANGYIPCKLEHVFIKHND